MINLYDELQQILKKNNKTLEDIKWISIEYDTWNEDMCDFEKHIFGVQIENFIDIAKKTKYDNGYGGAEIPGGLIIAGDNWWLERRRI